MQTLDNLDAEVVPDKSVAHVGEAFKLSDLIPACNANFGHFGHFGRKGWTLWTQRLDTLDAKVGHFGRKGCAK